MFRHTFAITAAAFICAASVDAADSSYKNLITDASTQEGTEQATLSMQEAVRLALSSDDPYLSEPALRAAALEDRAVAAAQLPDPKLRATFANWPTNSFSYTQEPMTQIQIGLSQSFPKGDTRALSRKKSKAMVKGEETRQALRRREIILDTRETWLELRHWQAAKGKVQASRQAVSELIKVVESIYSTGRSTSQDVLRAELELTLLDDRLVEIDRRIAMARAALARRIGAAAQRQINEMPPAMHHPSALMPLTELLAQHPVIRLQDTQIEVADRDVDIAHEQYKPGWSVNVGYGARGADRADFATVGVVMDVPLFTAKRQDKGLSAAKKTRQAATLGRDTILLDLRKKLEVTYADWQRLQDRVKLYENAVIKRAKETTEASLTAYQSGVTDFAELVRARLAELSAELKLLELQTNRMKAQARLLYLEGEDDA